MAGEKSLEEKARKFANQRPQQGKEFEQLQSAQNQLLQIQAAQQQNLKERKLESDYLAQQNQTLAQAAQVGMMSQGAGQMRVNPATQNALGRYGLSRPMTSTTTKQSQQSTVSRQNITIHNNTTNITTNNTNTVPANIGGPIQGRPVQFQQPQQPAAGGGGGMDKFKNWLNQTFAKQDETRRQREREYQKRETGLTKSANKMMRKLEEFSRDISKKLDPRNLGKNMGSELKTIFRLIGLGALVVNFRKILSKLDKAQDKVENVYIPEIKNFFKWIRGGKESGAEEPGFITKIKESISSIIIGKDPNTTIREAFQKEGLLGGIKTAISSSIGEFFDRFKKELSSRWDLVRVGVPKPEKFEAMEWLKYITDMLQVMVGGAPALQGVIQNRVTERAKEFREDYFTEGFAGGGRGHRFFEKGLPALDKNGNRILDANGKEIEASLGAYEYGALYKYLSPTDLEKGELRKSLVPMFDSSGYKTDENGNIIGGLKTSISASVGQTAEIGTLLQNIRSGKGDKQDALMKTALKNIEKALASDGEIIIKWETLKLILGDDEATKRFGHKKQTFAGVSRPKTLQELRRGLIVRGQKTFEDVTNKVLEKYSGVRKVKSWGAFLTGAGGILSWAKFRLESDPGISGAVDLLLDECKNKGIKPYVIDFYPIPKSDQPDGRLTLMAIRSIYGEECHYVKESLDVVKLNKQEWDEIIKDMFGVNESFDFSSAEGDIKASQYIANKYLSYGNESAMATVLYDEEGNPIIQSPSGPVAIDEKTWQQDQTIYVGEQLAEQDRIRQANKDSFRQSMQQQSDPGRYLGGNLNTSSAPLPPAPTYYSPTNTSGFGTLGAGMSFSSSGGFKINTTGAPDTSKVFKNIQIQTGGSGSGEGDFEEGEQEETFTESSNTNFIYGADGAFDPVAAASWAYANYTEKSKGIAGGLCSDFVGMALRNGGSNAPGAGTVSNLEDYLKAHGWELTGLTADSDQSVWQIGDVAILYKVAGKRYGDGHACMYVGNNIWISDVIHQGGGVLKSFQDVRIYRYVDDPTANHSAMPGGNWNRQPNVNHIKYAVDRWFRLGKKYGVGELFKDTNGRSYDRVPGNKDAVEAVLNDPNATVEQFIAAAYTPFPANRGDVKLSAEEVLSAYQSGGTNNQIPDIQYNGPATDSILGGKGMQNFLGFLSRSKEVIKNATGGLVHQVRYLADGTKQVLIKGAEGGMKWETSYSGGLANYEHGVRKRSSAEQKIYDRYSGQSQVAYPTQTIRGKNRNEWWAGYFDENGNLKSKEVENINPELKKALDAIEVELKKSNGMDELQLKLAAESLDNTMIANAGATAREQRMINALVARNQVTEKAGMSTLGAERGINKKG